MSTPYNRTIKAIIIHHMGDGLPPDVTILKRWNPQGYDYPEYDLGVEADGIVRQGRPLTYQGAHCLTDKPPYSARGQQWFNQHAVGIGLAGDFTKYPMPAAQFNALVALTQKLMAQYGLTLDDVYPHGQVTYTACPGATYAKVPALKGLWSYDDFEKAVMAKVAPVVSPVKEEKRLKHAILLNTENDFWAGSELARKLGAPVFLRLADKSAPVDAAGSDHLIVVGGAKIGHPNETLLSGNDKFDTAAVVKKYLGGL